eukprot:2690481-Alexandrium_andersonii.AAC.1
MPYCGTDIPTSRKALYPSKAAEGVVLGPFVAVRAETNLCNASFYIARTAPRAQRSLQTPLHCSRIPAHSQEQARGAAAAPGPRPQTPDSRPSVDDPPENALGWSAAPPST